MKAFIQVTPYPGTIKGLLINYNMCTCNFKVNKAETGL